MTKEFTETVAVAVKEKLGPAYEVTANEVHNTNGSKIGITIRQEKNSVAPTIYIADHASEDDVELIADSVIQQFKAAENKVDNGFVKCIRDRQWVLEHVVYQLIGKEKNQALLDSCPHRDFLDMAAIYTVYSKAYTSGHYVVKLTEENLRGLKITQDQIDKAARENTNKDIVCFRLFDAESVLFSPGEIRKHTIANCDFSGHGPLNSWALTNASMMYGAALMLYPEIFRDIAEKAKADLYILPSSINEVILLKNDGSEDDMRLAEIKNMVKSVNRNEVAPEEVLTGSVYRYSRGNEEIELAI